MEPQRTQKHSLNKENTQRHLILSEGFMGNLLALERCVVEAKRAGIVPREAQLIDYVTTLLVKPCSECTREERQRVCVTSYLGLVQVAVHGLSDISGMDSIVIWILGLVVLLHHAWKNKVKV